MGELAYFGPLERPHGLQTWIAVQDPSITASMANFLKVSEQISERKRKRGFYDERFDFNLLLW